jgi:8-amino-3,8-dideoxy-alpha-D-manno-octulosonate transaminase
MDLSELESLITPKTKAILAVHMLGAPSDIHAINSVAKIHDIPVVEDNCEALGSLVGNSYSGTVSDIGVLSFDFGKTITTGEGGALLTNRKELDKIAREYHDHGHECNPKLPRGKDTRTIQGFNYRMTEMQAVIGKVQLSRLEYIIKNSKDRYECLGSVFKTSCRPLVNETTINYDTFIFHEKDSKVRTKIVDLLNKEKFGTKNLPDALDWHSAYRWDHLLDQASRESIKTSDNILTESIAIPIFLSKSVVEYKKIASKILKIKCQG